MNNDPRALALGAKAHQGPFVLDGMEAGPELRAEISELFCQGLAEDVYAFRCENCKQHFAHVGLVDGQVMEIPIMIEQIQTCHCNVVKPFMLNGDKGLFN